jgi:hypothetical protein
MAMKRLCLMGTILFGLCASVFAQTERLSLACDTLEICVSYLEAPDTSCEPECFGLIDENKGYFSLPAEFEKFGRAAIPKLLENLKSPHESVRSRAGLILSKSNHVQPEDHVAILEGYALGNSWLRSSVRKLVTPEIVAKMGDALRLHDGHGVSMPRTVNGRLFNNERLHPEDAVYSAFLALGPHAEDYLIKRFTCADSNSCEYRYLPILSAAFNSDTGPMPRFAKHLFGLAAQPSLSADARTAALKTAIRAMDDPTHDEHLAILRAFLKSEIADIRDMAFGLLMLKGDPSVLEMAIKNLDEKKGYAAQFALFDVMRFGSQAVQGLPSVSAFLKNEDWEVRFAAMRTISEIGNQEAICGLISNISEADWQLSIEIMVVLERFQCATEIKQLAVTAEKNWHPAARAEARRVMDGKPRKSGRFFSTIDPYCSEVMPAQHPPPGTATGQTQKDIDDWNNWYQSVWTKYHHDVDAAASFTPMSGLKHTLQIGEWLFSGEDKGEFGGFVSATRKGQPPQRLSDKNLRGFFQTTTNTYFVTGLSHLGLDRAFLHKLSQNADGTWRAETVLRLAGSGDFHVSKDGTLRNISYQGAMLVHPDGKPEWIMCPPHMP